MSPKNSSVSSREVIDMLFGDNQTTTIGASDVKKVLAFFWKEGEIDQIDQIDQSLFKLKVKGKNLVYGPCEVQKFIMDHCKEAEIPIKMEILNNDNLFSLRISR